MQMAFITLTAVTLSMGTRRVLLSIHIRKGICHGEVLGAATLGLAGRQACLGCGVSFVWVCLAALVQSSAARVQERVSCRTNSLAKRMRLLR